MISSYGGRCLTGSRRERTTERTARDIGLFPTSSKPRASQPWAKGLECLRSHPHAVLRGIDIREQPQNPCSVRRPRWERVEVQQIVARMQPRRSALLFNRPETRVVQLPFSRVWRQKPVQKFRRAPRIVAQQSAELRRFLLL